MFFSLAFCVMVAAASSENQMPRMANNIQAEVTNCSNNVLAPTPNREPTAPNSNDQTEERSYLEITCEVIYTLIGLLYLLLEATMKCIIPTKYQTKDVKGYVVLVTGAGSGIGRRLAIKFAELGCKMVLWDINGELNEETAVIIRQKGGNVHTFVCDVSNRNGIYRTAEKVKERVGFVDILINNAGIVTGTNLLDCPDQAIIQTMQVNILAHFWTIKAFLPEMIERNSGHIVTISSAAGVIGLNKLTEYCASKFACVGLDESLRFELGMLQKHGVHMTLACPYYTDTGMFEGAQTRFPSILPVLDTEFVAEKIVQAILCNQEVLYVPRILYFIVALKGVLPAKCWSLVLRFTGSGQLMDHFSGRTKSRPENSENHSKIANGSGRAL